MSDADRMIARIREGLTWVPSHWDRNDMRYCLGWAFDELERLRAGGCARDQKTTQYCAEAAKFAEMNALAHGREDALKKRVDFLEYELRKSVEWREGLSRDNERLQRDLNVANGIIYDLTDGITGTLAKDEKFALAANQCHGGYGDESGNHRCKYQDDADEQSRELERVKVALANAVSERDALTKRLAKTMLDLAEARAKR